MITKNCTDPKPSKASIAMLYASSPGIRGNRQGVKQPTTDQSHRNMHEHHPAAVGKAKLSLNVPRYSTKATVRDSVAPRSIQVGRPTKCWQCMHGSWTRSGSKRQGISKGVTISRNTTKCTKIYVHIELIATSMVHFSPDIKHSIQCRRNQLDTHACVLLNPTILEKP